MPKSVEFKGNGEFAIHVPDLDKALQFYQGVLGLKLESRSDDMLAFNAGKFMLYVNRDERIQPYIPSFDVADVEQARTQLLAAGSKITRDGPGGFYFTDPFGLTLDVIGKK